MFNKKKPKENEGNKLIAQFALGIKMEKRDDGTTDISFQSMNQNVPVELLIMQLKSFVRKLEDDYYDNYKNHTVEEGKKD